MSTRTLWLARHPPVDARGLCYGRTDVKIVGTAEGAAAQLARTQEVPCAIVWSSPASRCATVAAALAPRWRAEVRIDSRLLEMDFGVWDGRSWSEIEHGDPDRYTSWMRDWKVHAPPQGERLDELSERVSSWLRELRGEATADTEPPPVPHACVAHAGVIRALLVLTERISWDDAMEREIPHLAWLGLSV